MSRVRKTAFAVALTLLACASATAQSLGGPDPALMEIDAYLGAMALRAAMAALCVASVLAIPALGLHRRAARRLAVESMSAGAFCDRPLSARQISRAA